MDLPRYVETLKRAGVDFAPGLTPAEMRAVEEAYGFRFPPDLAAFLSFALPVSAGFIDWRRESAEQIRDALEWPYEGMCFDIEHNVFWLPEWGGKPETLEEAYAIARRAVDYAPKLIPIAGHRYIPDRPNEAGNPVFSVHQTDIIYYGATLANYLENEFSYYFHGSSNRYVIEEPVKRIEFWSRIVDDNNEGFSDG